VLGELAKLEYKTMKRYYFVVTVLFCVRAINSLSCDPCNPSTCVEPLYIILCKI